jgi:hypothetical protein
MIGGFPAKWIVTELATNRWELANERTGCCRPSTSTPLDGPRQKVGFENMNRVYSVRNAFTGSIDAARRAGIQHATRAIAVRNAGTIAKVSASCG